MEPRNEEELDELVGWEYGEYEDADEAPEDCAPEDVDDGDSR